MPDDTYAAEDRDTLRAIHRAMDGAEWNADTLQTIADILREAGWAVREVQK